METPHRPGKDAVQMKDGARARDVLDRLVQWAKNQPLVRAMVLESSRASDRMSVDILSDYDVLLVVGDTRPFSRDETWLQEFGKILVLFRDKGRTHELTTYNRLVLYEDGTKIDYIIWPVVLLQRVLVGNQLCGLLDARTWDELARTYVGESIEENCDALFQTTALFSRSAIEVGNALGYRYPYELEEGVTGYLQRIRNLE